MRRSIFDILSEDGNREKEIERIDSLFEEKNVISLTDLRTSRKAGYSIKEYTDIYCFSGWKNRGHCLDLDDFLETVKYYDLCTFGEDELEDYLLFIEIIYNFWHMAFLKLNEMIEDGNLKVAIKSKFALLNTILNDELSRYNFKAVYDEEKQQMLVVEDKPEVTAAAEVADEDIAMDILRYNHFTMRGDLKAKKAVLLAMGANLEPKQGEIEKANKQLKSDIFYMLNNINIRHNNSTPGDKNYKQAVAEMDDETLETWYDELYQMMLLAILEMDQVERFEKVKELKTQVNG